MVRVLGVCMVGVALAVTAVPVQAVDLAVPDTPVPAAPVEETVRAPSGLQLSIGLGAAYAPDYEGSDDYQGVPLWNLRLGNLYHPETYVRLFTTRLDSNFLADDHWRLGIVSQFRPDYGDVDDGRVSRLNTPSDSLQTGVVLGYDFWSGLRQDAVIELEGTYDLLHGNGSLVTPRARLNVPLSGGLTLGAQVSGSWASEDYMSNRFGISGGDAGRSGLSRFDADEGFKDTTLSASLTYALTDNWSTTVLGAYRRLLGDAADSPIVDDRGDENQFALGALVNYRF
jgi:outer membrane protein